MFVFFCLGLIFRYLFCADQQQTPGSNKAEGLALDERVASVSNKNKKVFHILLLVMMCLQRQVLTELGLFSFIIMEGG